MIAVGGQGYVYSTTNRLAIAPQAGVELYADSLERLDYIGGENLLVGHDGERATSEHSYNGTTNPVARRYVYGPGVDEPLVVYEGSTIADGTRRYLHADERGSVVAVTGTYGTLIARNAYDEYGTPAAGNVGRFGYTGQAWLPGIGLWYYKARMYAPKLGRFLQTDPIGYDAGMNLYGYVAGDPVNYTDPSGTDLACNDGRYFTAAELTKFGDVAPCDGDVIAPGGRGGSDGFGFDDFFRGGGFFYGGGGFGTGGSGGATVGPSEPREEQPRCPGGSRINFSGGLSATGFLGILGLSVGGGGNVSIPVASLPLIGDGSFRGTQLSGSLSATPLAGVGLFVGAGPNYSLGGLSGPTQRGFSGSITPTMQVGAGDGGGVEVGSDFTSPLSLSGSGGRIAAGAYGAVGARFQGTASTGQIGCR